MSDGEGKNNVAIISETLGLEEEEKINEEEAVDEQHRRRDSSSSSSSSDNNESHGHDGKTNNRLFGRQKPIHAALGGGKSADIILWRNKQSSASMIASATVIWVLFEWMGYHLLAFVCHSLILSLAVLFLWSNLSSFLNKSPLHFPEVVLPEEPFTSIALFLMKQFNHTFAIFREVASGKNLKKFLYAILALWVLSVVGSWFDFLTLLYILFVMMLTVPLLYEMHEDSVDTYGEKAAVEIKKQYAVLDQKFLQKLPKVPFIKDTKRH